MTTIRLLLAVTILALSAGAQTTPKADDSKDKGGAVSHKAAETPDQVRDYWTPERMKNAKPKEMPTPKPEAGKNQTPPSGQPGSTEGQPPSQKQ
jgi:hypothetical protein